MPNWKTNRGISSLKTELKCLTKFSLETSRNYFAEAQVISSPKYVSTPTRIWTEECLFRSNIPPNLPREICMPTISSETYERVIHSSHSFSNLKFEIHSCQKYHTKEAHKCLKHFCRTFICLHLPCWKSTWTSATLLFLPSSGGGQQVVSL